MSRQGFRRFLTAAFLGVFAVTSLMAGDAEAAKKKRRKKKAAVAAKVAPTKITTGEHAKALGELMGPYKFGQSSKDIVKILGTQITERYNEMLKATTDVYAQDKLRRKRDAEIERIKKSHIAFTGNRGGWDVSIIDTEFSHNSDESMLVHWENEAGSGRDQRRFFFFHHGKLYKMFIALNSGSLKEEQKNFAYFKGLMEARYGGGKVVQAKDIDGVVRPIGIDWRTKSYHVTALDKLSFYGSFCLVIADPSEEKELVAVRDRNKVQKNNAVMKSVLAGDGDDTPGLDDNKGAVDAVIRGE